jgi:hypothetical protein
MTVLGDPAETEILSIAQLLSSSPASHALIEQARKQGHLKNGS